MPRDSLKTHHELVDATRSRPDVRFEFVYVDDGSTDGSYDELIALRAADDRVTVVSLSRNHGHRIAVTAGLDMCGDADAVVVMDTDLQDPPAVSLRMFVTWEAGADVVYGQRRTRQDTWFKRTTASGFYSLLDRVSEVDISRDVGDFRLMDRRVVAEVARYREHDRFLRGIVAQVGFRQEAILYDRAPRTTGTSGYRLSLHAPARGKWSLRVLHHPAAPHQPDWPDHLDGERRARRVRVRGPRIRPGSGGSRLGVPRGRNVPGTPNCCRALLHAA